MKAQSTEIESQLARHGWEIADIKVQGLEWWADEIWLLESAWSPVGAQAYVTFLVDPQCPPDRKKGQDVWAVKASAKRPAGWLEERGEFTLSLGRGWKEELPGFIEHLSRLRNEDGISVP